MLGWKTASGAIFLATAFVMSGCGKSEQAPPQAQAPAAQQATPQNEASGATGQTQPAVKAYVDESGQLREATPEEIAEAAKRSSTPANQSPKTPVRKEIRLPDGTVGVILDESTQESVQGCVQPDGTVVMKHTCDDAKSKAGKQ